MIAKIQDSILNQPSTVKEWYNPRNNCMKNKKTNYPGPCDYEIKLTSKPIFSKLGTFGPIPRKKLKKRTNNPAPNTYNLSSIYLIRRQDFNQAPYSRVFQKDIAIKIDQPKESIPAPCDYQKLNKVPKFGVTMSAFKSTSTRTNEELTSLPGPGYYNFYTDNQSCKIPDSAFASKTIRSAIHTNKDIPGPGSYNLNDCKTIPNKLPSLSKKKLFKSVNYPQSNNTTIINTNPGPGSYNISSNQVKKHFMSSAVFLSNVSRWILPNELNGINYPGPTSYKPYLPSKYSFHYNINKYWI